MSNSCLASQCFYQDPLFLRDLRVESLPCQISASETTADTFPNTLPGIFYADRLVHMGRVPDDSKKQIWEVFREHFARLNYFVFAAHKYLKTNPHTRFCCIVKKVDISMLWHYYDYVTLSNIVTHWTLWQHYTFSHFILCPVKTTGIKRCDHDAQSGTMV